MRFDHTNIDLTLSCSKGTNIRTLQKTNKFTDTNNSAESINWHYVQGNSRKQTSLHCVEN